MPAWRATAQTRESPQTGHATPRHTGHATPGRSVTWRFLPLVKCAAYRFATLLRPYRRSIQHSCKLMIVFHECPGSDRMDLLRLKRTSDGIGMALHCSPYAVAPVEQTRGGHMKKLAITAALLAAFT